MKNKIHFASGSIAALMLLAGAFIPATAQTPPPQTSTQDAPPAQAVQAPNLQAELNLTPEQIQKWRALNIELREQEFNGNQRLRQARRGLADAMESPNPNEDVIKQRAKELADAQSAMTQLQALRQARVLQILTPEQRIKLREIRERQKEQNQALRRNGQQLPRNGLGRQGGVQRNAITPPPTPRQRRLLKQGQKR